MKACWFETFGAAQDVLQQGVADFEDLMPLQPLQAQQRSADPLLELYPVLVAVRDLHAVFQGQGCSARRDGACGEVF